VRLYIKPKWNMDEMKVLQYSREYLKKMMAR